MVQNLFPLSIMVLIRNEGMDPLEDHSIRNVMGSKDGRTFIHIHIEAPVTLTEVGIVNS